MKIEIYTTPLCHYCKDVKALLDEKKLPYTVYDVASNPEYRKNLIELAGRLAVPVTLINNEVFVGFDDKLKNRLEELK